MRKCSLNFVFICLTLALAACGKKIDDVKSHQANITQVENSKVFSIKYQHTALTSQTVIPRNANFKIPDHFTFLSDSTLSQEFEIIYNFNPDNFTFEFRCFYRPDNQMDEFQLDRCLDFSGNNLGNVTGVDFMLDAGKTILLRSQESQPFHFTVDYQVEWK